MATQTGSIDLAATNGVKLYAKGGFDSIEQNYATKAELDVQADRIGMVVANDDTSGSLQLTADAMDYIGDHVTIKGTDGTTTVISGGRVQANSLAIGALDSAAQQATLNSNVQVGGRNLLIGTGDWSHCTISSGSGSASGDTFTFSANSSLGWYSVSFSNPHMPFSDVDGKTLTLSFDYRSDDFSDTSGDHYIWINAAASATENGSRSKYRQISTSEFDGVFVPTTEWQRGTITFDVSQGLFTSGSGEINYFYIQFYNHTLNSLQLRHVKLEQGNKPTDWSPAPEDQTEYADEASAQSAQPNLSPFFEISSSDSTYWFSTGNLVTYTSKLANGWTHLTSTNVSLNVSPKSGAVELKNSTTYTVMLEVRNAATLTGCTFYVYAPSNSMWATAKNVSVTADGVYYLTSTTKANLSDSAITHLRLFIGGTSSTIDADIRISLYEGEYNGPFKPYSGTKVLATQYITTIDATNGIKIADANPSSATTYLQLASTFLDFIREGTSMLKAWVDNIPMVRIGAENSFNTLIDSSGINFKEGYYTLGRFSSNLIELGSNSINAVISLCNGAGKIVGGEGGTIALEAQQPHVIGTVTDGTTSSEAGLSVRTNNYSEKVCLYAMSDDASNSYCSIALTPIIPGLYSVPNMEVSVGNTTKSFPMTDFINAIPVTLYDNASAAASAAATLSETAANFKRLTIFFKDTDSNYSSVDVWSPNGKRVALSLTWINGASTQEMYQRVRWVTISGTSISTYKASSDSKYRTGQVKLGATASVTNSDYLAIVHVIGYR